MSKQIIRLIRPLTDEENLKINQIVREKGLKKGAFLLQAIQEKIENESRKS